MNKLFLAIMVATSALLAVPVFAQTGMTTSGAPTAMSEPLFKTFGEKPGLTRLMDDFMIRLLADPRTGSHFKNANQTHLKMALVEQFCMVTGGPCTYNGGDMKSVHGNLDISKSDFNALVEVLQLSMDAQGIAFRAQNQLLAKLAPMHRDIITVD
jgi:hemoglobin